MNTDPVLLTHVDLDGAACAVLFQLYMPMGRVEYHTHKTIDQATREHAEAGSRVILADISPSREVLEWVRDTGANVSIFDHHAKAPWATMHAEEGFDGGYNPNICGARVFHREYKAFFGGTVGIGWLLNVTEARDLWKKDSPLWEQGCYLTQMLKLMGIGPFVYWLTPRIHNYKPPSSPRPCGRC